MCLHQGLAKSRPAGSLVYFQTELKIVCKSNAISSEVIQIGGNTDTQLGVNIKFEETKWSILAAIINSIEKKLSRLL